MKSKLKEELYKKDWRWALCWDGRQDIKYEGLDCACCLMGEDLPKCNCVCHKRIKQILSLIKSEILKGMPKEKDRLYQIITEKGKVIITGSYKEAAEVIGDGGNVEKVYNQALKEVRDYIKKL